MNVKNWIFGSKPTTLEDEFNASKEALLLATIAYCDAVCRKVRSSSHKAALMKAYRCHLRARTELRNQKSILSIGAVRMLYERLNK